MALSKISYLVIGTYFDQKFNHPFRTLCISSGIEMALASYVAKTIYKKGITSDDIVPYGLYGLIFGGSIHHFFYLMIEKLNGNQLKHNKFIHFILDQGIYTPLFLSFLLYSVSRFECKDHKNSLKHLKALYIPLLKKNWQYFTILLFLNQRFVPGMLRSTINSLINFVWVVYVITERNKLKKSTKKVD